MKKFTLILIVVAIIFVGYALFPLVAFLWKVFVGLLAAALICGGAYLGYFIGKNLSKGKI